jgi:hypothetical protein
MIKIISNIHFTLFTELFLDQDLQMEEEVILLFTDKALEMIHLQNAC